jgi:integrase/recombinase XerD
MMTHTLFDQCGKRKYLIASERMIFCQYAKGLTHEQKSFCLTLAVTGARISEVLALTSGSLDRANGAVIFRTLKQRDTISFRAIPVPNLLFDILEGIRGPVSSDARLWGFGRTTAWKIVKYAMRESGIPEHLCKPKALRHAFAVDAGQNGVPLNIVQRWLGHSRIETTSIYLNVLGKEERGLARRTWEAASFGEQI